MQLSPARANQMHHAQAVADGSQHFVECTGRYVGEPKASLDAVEKPHDDKDLRELQYTATKR
jgi:hypothetical protein